MLTFVRSTRRGSRRLHCFPRRARRPLRLEELEERSLLAFLGPSQVAHAYGFDKLPYDGSGQTIAIVDAYDNPNVASDLAAFDQAFNLPDPVFTVAQPQGKPNNDTLWGLEIDLDVQWAHAMAPGANILLVEARTNSFSDMLAAVDYAKNRPGVVAVSMSWGSSEFGSETALDSHFTTPAGHMGGSNLPGGVTFLAASGDHGSTSLMWPGTSPNVLSIGGTALTLDDSNNIDYEIGWWGSGGGISMFEAKPDAQSPFQGYGTRTAPDFSYNADVSSPYWIYDSFNFGGLVGVYGTSAGTPQWAALIALADQALALHNIGSLDGATQAIPGLYNLANVSYATYFNDILSGSNGYDAGPGYDLVTGIGSPIADQVVQGLVDGFVPPPGGGAAAPGAELPPLTHGTRKTSSSGSSTPFVPVSRSLSAHPGTILGSIAPRQNGSTSPPTAFVLAATPNPGSEFAPTTFAVPASPGNGTPALKDVNAATPIMQPIQPLSRLPESRVETGGGFNGVLDEESTEDGAPDMVVPPVSDSASGAVNMLSRSGASQQTLVVADWRQAAEACFALDQGRASMGEPAGALTVVTDPFGVLPDPLAAIGALAIALGCSWGQPPIDRKPERTRRWTVSERP